MREVTCPPVSGFDDEDEIVAYAVPHSPRPTLPRGVQFIDVGLYEYSQELFKKFLRTTSRRTNNAMNGTINRMKVSDILRE